VAERTARFLGGRKADPDRIAQEVRALQLEIRDSEEGYRREAEAWRRALSAEQARRREEAWPAVRSAAARVARLVEALSREVADARAAQAKLAEVGAAVPDIGREFGSLSEYYSAVSTWNKRMLAEGLL
jgi:hypothetical protein